MAKGGEFPNQQQIADKVGLSRSTVSRILREMHVVIPDQSRVRPVTWTHAKPPLSQVSYESKVQCEQLFSGTSTKSDGDFRFLQFDLASWESSSDHAVSEDPSTYLDHDRCRKANDALEDYHEVDFFLDFPMSITTFSGPYSLDPGAQLDKQHWSKMQNEEAL
ncbi:Hypothetical protein D9617_45g091380 [Elsinoe fawcettii]|nr:Hypothetical protein D9617_45g091380 [Elsinoe fawcettii]